MAAFLAGSLLWFYLFVKLISPVYKKLNTSLVTYHTRSNYKLTELKASSQIHALYKKELKRFFSSTIYCLNMGMGCLMTLVLAIALIFVRFDQLDQMTEFPTWQKWQPGFCLCHQCPDIHELYYLCFSFTGREKSMDTEIHAH